MDGSSGILCIAIAPLGFIILIYSLDPGVWDRIRSRGSRPSSTPPGAKNIKKRSRKK